MTKYHQIKDFYPHLKNPQKYKGTRPITLRSGWEITLAKRLDKNKAIIKWSSESVIIPYYNPIKGRMARYFMDFHIYYKTKDGKIKEEIWEVKPFKQTQPPKTQKRKTKKYIKECATYVVNDMKWKATKKWIESLRSKGRDISFKIITEKDIFKNGKPL